MSNTKTNFFLGLQAIRFFAAAAVLVYHLFVYARAFGMIRNPHWGVAERILPQGVIVFFVLSGFLMARAMESGTPARFLAHRLLRIYPATIVAICLALPIALLRPDFAVDWRAYTLLPFGAPGSAYPLGIEWTLVYEVFFYAVITIFCTLPSNLTRWFGVLSWCAAILGANIFLPSTYTAFLPDFFHIPFSYFNLAFLIGMASWLVFKSELRAPSLYTLPVAAILLTGFGWHTTWLLSLLATSTGAAILIVDAARWPISSKNIFVLGGNASFGIYLSHVSTILAIYTLSGLRGNMAVIVAGVSALFIGVVFGLSEFAFYRCARSIADGIMGYNRISEDPNVQCK